MTKADDRLHESLPRVRLDDCGKVDVAIAQGGTWRDSPMRCLHHKGKSRVYLRIATCLAAIALAGCGMRSFVTSVGNGEYEVSGSSTTLASGADEKARLVKAADEYCAHYGRSTVIIASREQDAKPGTLAAPGSIAKAQVRFRCK